MDKKYRASKFTMEKTFNRFKDLLNSFLKKHKKIYFIDLFNFSGGSFINSYADAQPAIHVSYGAPTNQAPKLSSLYNYNSPKAITYPGIFDALTDSSK